MYNYFHLHPLFGCSSQIHIMYTKDVFLFLLQIWASQGAATHWFADTENLRKGWLMTYLILLPHTPALFDDTEMQKTFKKVGSWHIWYFCHTCQPCLMTWTQTAGHKMAACIFVTFKHRFLTSRTRRGVKNCWVHILKNFIPIDKVCDASTFWFHFNSLLFVDFTPALWASCSVFQITAVLYFTLRWTCKWCVCIYIYVCIIYVVLCWDSFEIKWLCPILNKTWLC